MHIYTLKGNAVRAAKKQGLTAAAVHEGQGGFYIVPPAATAAAAKPGSKNALLLGLLTRKGGATLAQLMEALGWKAPSVRCAIQRVTKAHGMTWARVAGENVAESRWTASAAN